MTYKIDIKIDALIYVQHIKYAFYVRLFATMPFNIVTSYLGYLASPSG